MLSVLTNPKSRPNLSTVGSFFLVVFLFSPACAQERADLYREISDRFDRLADIEANVPTPDPTPDPDPPPDPTPDPDPTPSPDPNPPSGGARDVWINMTGCHSWDDMTIYRNAFKENYWVTEYRGSEYVLEIPLDGSGWPAVEIPHNGKEMFGTVEINADLPIVDNRPFTLIQRGRSKIKIAGVGTFSNQSGVKKSIVQFPRDTQKSNIFIESAEVGARWELIYPGEENSTSRFHSSTLNSLKRFGGIRFMDWQKTNGSIQKTWADSNQPGTMTESTPTGSSWDSAIALANETGTDMWICIPHGVDTDYTKTLAKLVESQFRGSRIVIEYSNECWNYSPAFRDQLTFCQDHGKRLNPSETNSIKQQASGYGDLAGQHFAAFRAAYGGSADVDYVLCWQSTANWSPLVAFDACPNENAIGHAPYVFVGGSEWKTQSIDQVFERLNGEGLERCRENITKWNQWAKDRGLKSMIYECGHHVYNSSHTYQITHDPRMTDLIVAFDRLVAGGDVRCYFNFGGLPRRNSDFGHQSFSGDYQDPKWKALEIITAPSIPPTAFRKHFRNRIAESPFASSL